MGVDEFIEKIKTSEKNAPLIIDKIKKEINQLNCPNNKNSEKQRYKKYRIELKKYSREGVHKF